MAFPHRNERTFGPQRGSGGIWDDRGVSREVSKALRMQDLVSSRHISEEELAAAGIEAASAEEIFRTCDIVSLHNSLTMRTKHSIGTELLNSMKTGLCWSIRHAVR